MRKSQADRVCRIVFRDAPLAVAATTLILSVGINLVNVIGRYLFQNAIYWAEEAMIYMAIWSIFLAAIATAYDGCDLTMDLVSNRLPSPWKRLFDGTMTATTVAICLFMSWQSSKLMGTLIRNGQKSLALEIPIWIPQSSIFFGFAMIACAVVARFFLRGRDNGLPSAQNSAAVS